MQGQALPLGQGVDHGGGLVHVSDFKGNGAFHAVQVVVEAGGDGDEQGGGHPAQPEGAAEAVLKEVVQQADGLLGVVHAQQGPVAGGDFGVFHRGFSFCFGFRFLL